VLSVSRFVMGRPMISIPLKTPERNDHGDSFDQWVGYAVAVFIAIVMIVILNSTSPRTAFYALSVFLLFLIFVRWVIALVRSLMAD
jgi:hypothetical protein